jgi:hypothetical protein
MAIVTYANYKAAKKQTVELMNTVNITSVANTMFSCWNGTLAGTNTAAGVVPTDADTGLPDYGSRIDTFEAGAKGYLTRVIYVNQGVNSANGIGILFDMVFKAGAYAFNANTILAAQPSYAARMPGGTDYTDTEIWFECVTAFTGNLTLTVTYTNESGTAGRTTGSFAPAVAPTVRRCFRLPLQSGDTGVQKIESVVSTVATAGTFNILVLRRLNMGRVVSAIQDVRVPNLNGSDVLLTGIPEVFDTSCLTSIQLCDSTSTGQPYFLAEVASG